MDYLRHHKIAPDNRDADYPAEYRFSFTYSGSSGESVPEFCKAWDSLLLARRSLETSGDYTERLALSIT
ncbi:MAG: hypothetical protein LBK58_00240 [Prevotellaceae bacterium]|nr:hypothetical protein [Prevotellaceae bacterium]